MRPLNVLNQKPGNYASPPSAGTVTWHAVVELAGSQTFVSPGRFYSCHRLPGTEEGSELVFERVLAAKDQESGKVHLGFPYLAGAKVHATVLESYRDKKVTVFKMKAKKHYRRIKGHRQSMTRFLVTKVELPKA